jgi:hypothetical protein
LEHDMAADSATPTVIAPKIHGIFARMAEAGRFKGGARFGWR